jgi:rubrerythrin
LQPVPLSFRRGGAGGEVVRRVRQTKHMREFANITEILDFAIGEEQAAVDFYLQLAGQSKNQQTRKVFLEYAEEEMRH